MGRFRVGWALVASVAALSCAGFPDTRWGTQEESTVRRTLPEGAEAPLFHDLGDHHHPITASSELVQRYFDQGLRLTFAFNHAEAIRSFREASRLDPSCALCFWGEAYALGPNINKPMDDADVLAAWAAVEKALGALDHVTESEKAYVHALAKRYASKPVADRRPLDREFAAAMRQVAESYPDDLDAQAIFAESLMNTMPWDYYTAAGTPKPDTVEVIATLEAIQKKEPNHPAAVHLYIHAVEASSSPERAEAAADRLGALMPGAGHLVHMPSHIYIRLGRYHDASTANELAAEADESYIAACRAQGFYPALYYPHNIHFLWASASMEGRSQTALSAASKLVDSVPVAQLGDFPFMEEFLPTHLFGLARFGRWGKILNTPKPPESQLYATGMWHYARGLALAATGGLTEAEEARVEVAASAELEAMSGLGLLSAGSTGRDLLRVADRTLAGEIALARGDTLAAIAAFEAAVALQDGLPYSEPPPWYFPVRESLGRALLAAGHAARAEAVHRKQLEKTPRSGWSLYGLAESLRAQGKKEQAAEVQRRLGKAWAEADVELPSLAPAPEEISQL